MKFRSWLFVLVLAAFGPVCVRAGDELRFTKSLTADQFTDLGLGRLSSDQIASLDALVRRDLARADIVTKDPRPDRFSQRLAATERDSAGLDLLTASEVTALDARVQSLMPPPRQAYSVADYADAGGALPSVSLRRRPEVHGEVSLVVGAGSHGYSMYGGGILLEVDDPEHNLALAIAYSELHEKGGWLRRDCREGWSNLRNLGVGLELGR
ncbi:MAG TPA: hypothetical protein VHE13_14920 [Opitutus sp.]|nr:hypothetical protein [Opitutus sp.]